MQNCACTCDLGNLEWDFDVYVVLFVTNISMICAFSGQAACQWWWELFKVGAGAWNSVESNVSECCCISAWLWSRSHCLQCFYAVGWAAVRHPACKKLEWWGAGMVICLELGADLHVAQLMPLPLTVSCFSKIQIGFTFLVPAHLGSPGQRAIKWVSLSLIQKSTCLVCWQLKWPPTTHCVWNRRVTSVLAQ